MRRVVRIYVEHIILDCQLDMNIIITTITTVMRSRYSYGCPGGEVPPLKLPGIPIVAQKFLWCSYLLRKELAGHVTQDM